MGAAPGWSPGANPRFPCPGSQPVPALQLQGGKTAPKELQRAQRGPVVGSGRGWAGGRAPLTIQGTDAEKVQRERRELRSHLASPVPLLSHRRRRGQVARPSQPPNSARGGGRAPLTPSLAALCPGPRDAGPRGPAADTQDLCVRKWGCVARSGVTAGKGDPDRRPGHRRQ